MHTVTHPPPNLQPSQAQRNERLLRDRCTRAAAALQAAAECLEEPTTGRCQFIGKELRNTGLGNPEIRHLLGDSGREFSAQLQVLGMRFEALGLLMLAAERDDDSDPADDAGRARKRLMSALAGRLETVRQLGADWREEMGLDQPTDWEAYS